MALVGGVEHEATSGVQRRACPWWTAPGVINPIPEMAVGVVVPVDERAAVSAGALDVVEAGGELGAVLQGLEVRLRVGVVAGGVRPRVRACDPEVGEQERDRLGALRRAAVGMQGEHLGCDLLLLSGLIDQRRRELGVLAVLHCPGDDVAAVLFPDPLCGRG